MTRLRCPYCGGPRSISVPETFVTRVTELTFASEGDDKPMTVTITAPCTAVSLRCTTCGRSRLTAEETTAQAIRDRAVEVMRERNEEFRGWDERWIYHATLADAVDAHPAALLMVMQAMEAEGAVERKEVAGHHAWRMVQ